jgi:DNA-binding MarR family transcriptional regulator
MNTPSDLSLTARLLVEVVPAVNRGLRALVARQALPAFTLPQYRVLVQLGDHPLLSLKDLAEREGVEPPTMSRTVDTLVERGWVSRETNPRDRRAVRLTLTQAGADHVAKTRTQASGAVEMVLSTWNPEALEGLHTALLRLKASLLHPASGGMPGASS